jgi:hypothetical protein
MLRRLALVQFHSLYFQHVTKPLERPRFRRRSPTAPRTLTQPASLGSSGRVFERYGPRAARVGPYAPRPHRWQHGRKRPRGVRASAIRLVARRMECWGEPTRPTSPVWRRSSANGSAVTPCHCANGWSCHEEKGCKLAIQRRQDSGFGHFRGRFGGICTTPKRLTALQSVTEGPTCLAAENGTAG